MKKMQVTIEKMHYEPYPIKDMITAWEVEYTVEYDAATEFLSSLRNNISRLKELFDTMKLLMLILLLTGILL